jgi:hypothetical protein
MVRHLDWTGLDAVPKLPEDRRRELVRIQVVDAAPGGPLFASRSGFHVYSRNIGALSEIYRSRQILRLQEGML